MHYDKHDQLALRDIAHPGDTLFFGIMKIIHSNPS
jgi:hypothetical protein